MPARRCSSPRTKCRLPNETGEAVGVLFRPHPANAEQWRALDVASTENVAVWPPIGTDPNATDFQRDFFDSLYHSAAVVGINTSAQIAHAQEGTLHFQHLVDPGEGFVAQATTLAEHAGQLHLAIRDGSSAAARNRRFVETFLRPHGATVAAEPVFVETVNRLAAMPRPPAARERAIERLARAPIGVLTVVAHALAEDRPLWVYALRPVITTTVWTVSVPFRLSAGWHGTGYRRVKRAMRSIRRAWYESSRSVARGVRRARKPIMAIVRGAARRVAGRNA
jgi:hypothetical protein